MAILDTGREELPDDRPFGAEHPDAQAAAPESTFDGDMPADEGEGPPQLELGGEDVRLPWLEGDEDEYEDEDGPGIGQGLLLVLLGLVAIGAIVGGLYWVMRDRHDANLVANGGVISAPKQPYKTKPANPGGEVVAGTGDTSFAVAEGQSRPPQIDDKDETAKPGFASVAKADDTSAAKSAATAPASAAPAASAATTGIGVQVGAYTNKADAEKGWNTLKSQYPALADMSHRVLQGQADIGTVYRLQAVPGSLAEAKTLCSGMRQAGMSCQVKN